MSTHAIGFVHANLANKYQFQQEHPFHPVRYALTISLLEHVNAINKNSIIQPPSLDFDALLPLAHHAAYIDAIKGLSEPEPSQELMDSAEQYGLHGDDTPFFEGMHQAACSIVAGTVHAVEQVASGKLEHAYHMAGGLHHAMPDRAAGFCIYNDAVIAIRAAQQKHKLRVLYIDTDVHHGDGVQLAFYADPTVCTYSIHETGKFLFPGTGYQYERGIEHGYGTTVNVPLEPYTEDESWLSCFEFTLKQTIERYRPDLIISQHGCDAHAFDPLSHLHCSMSIYYRIPQLIHELAHYYCNGKWVALGGGGYDLWRVVPRAWSIVWLEMTQHPLIFKLRKANERNQLIPLPTKWLQQWSEHTKQKLAQYWLDEHGTIEDIPRRAEITAQNEKIARIAVQDM